MSEVKSQVVSVAPQAEFSLQELEEFFSRFEPLHLLQLDEVEDSDGLIDLPLCA